MSVKKQRQAFRALHARGYLAVDGLFDEDQPGRVTHHAIPQEAI